ncbi:exo-alpha-sialidase [Aquipuribacter hungaricus]|uniref:WD40/YVTN/BNR-like repeat-containing protein n=1 Tax=Aquipuribacter hungaricus TaxID=545624 RepID=A0ABV7WKU6_9MICO
MTVVLCIGTRKGLWLATSEDRREWRLSDPLLLMQEVPSVAVDTRGGSTRLLVGTRSEHWGPSVLRSDDLGATWSEPERGSIRFDEGDGAALARIWQLQPDGEDRPGVVWAGCEPISLWRSTDGGEHFDLVRGLWDHPHREHWGAGYGGAAAHSVLPSPVDGTVHVAMSTGGVYRSEDGGGSWQPRNSGISAYFFPGPAPEFGQCVHKIARDAGDPARLYAQNHHGVYRSDDSGDTWVSIADGLPSDFGFVVLADPATAGRVWVVPLVADGERVPPGGRLQVHRSDDAGSTWTASGQGLPDGCWNAVLRDAACVDDAGTAPGGQDGDAADGAVDGAVGGQDDGATGVYLGTRGGDVYASADGGRSFVEVARGLPDVLSVRAAVVRGAAAPVGA